MGDTVYITYVCKYVYECMTPLKPGSNVGSTAEYSTFQEPLRVLHKDSLFCLSFWSLKSGTPNPGPYTNNNNLRRQFVFPSENTHFKVAVFSVVYFSLQGQVGVK